MDFLVWVRKKQGRTVFGNSMLIAKTLKRSVLANLLISYCFYKYHNEIESYSSERDIRGKYRLIYSAFFYPCTIVAAFFEKKNAKVKAVCIRFANNLV